MSWSEMAVMVWRSWGLFVIGGLVVAAGAVPVCLVVIRRRIRRGWTPAVARRRAWAEFAVVIGTLPWTLMAMAPMTVGTNRVILVPLIDLVAQLTDESAYAFYQLTANLVFLLPMGAFLPLARPRVASLWRVAAIAAAYSTTIELLQLTVVHGRITSIDDILVNTVGAIIGALLTRPWWTPVTSLTAFP